MSEDHSAYVKATEGWVDDVVIAHNFCPFARYVRSPNTIRYSVIEARKPELVVMALENELSHLDNDASTSTTLIIVPWGFESFFDYLDLLALAERYIDHSGYRGVYQIASFHPDYVFDGESSDSASNYTNRSPYPTLHLLRESDLEKAVEEYPNTEDIPQRNIEAAQAKGCKHFDNILAKLKR